jgi:hypothetical protein
MAAALAVVLTGFQVLTVAQTAQVGPGADMKALHDEMQNKMASAKTDAERQQIMAEQHTKMQATYGQIHGQMHAPMGHPGHGGMMGMPWGDASMKKHMSSMPDHMAN